MAWFQKTFTLPSRSRGSYLITDTVLSELPEIRDYKVGMLNLFVQHTSCALSLNENWDDDVRADMSDALDRIAPYDRKGNLYRHSAEGEDDMPVGLFWNLVLVVGVVLMIIATPARSSGNEMLIVRFVLGSYQVCTYWCFGEYSHLQWSFGDWDLARNLVPRVPDKSTHAQGRCDHPG